MQALRSPLVELQCCSRVTRALCSAACWQLKLNNPLQCADIPAKDGGPTIVTLRLTATVQRRAVRAHRLVGFLPLLEQVDRVQGFVNVRQLAHEAGLPPQQALLHHDVRLVLLIELLDRGVPRAPCIASGKQPVCTDGPNIRRKTDCMHDCLPGW